MKKFYMTMVAMLCGVAAMAENKLYVPEVTLKAGEKGVIEICLENDVPVQTISFKLKTATGIKLTTKATDFEIVTDRLDLETAKKAAAVYAKKQFDKEELDEDEYEERLAEIEGSSYTDLFEVMKTGSIYSFNAIVGAVSYQDEDGKMAYTTFKGNDGALLKCPISVGTDVADGAYELELFEIVIGAPSDDNMVYNVATEKTAKIKVTVGDGTGINTINADDVNAPVYNVAGQRVSKAQRGVYIQNGKKVAVK